METPMIDTLVSANDVYNYLMTLYGRIDELEAKIDKVVAIADAIQTAFDGMQANPIMGRMFGLGK